MYKSRFAFLRLNAFKSRVLRSVRNQKLPVLLSSVRAHLKSINQLIYIEKSQLLLSGSDDFSIRIWTISGQYLGTLGTFKEWCEISEKPDFNVSNIQIPADINRVASSTTLNVYFLNITQRLTVRQVI